MRPSVPWIGVSSSRPILVLLGWNLSPGLGEYMAHGTGQVLTVPGRPR